MTPALYLLKKRIMLKKTFTRWLKEGGWKKTTLFLIILLLIDFGLFVGDGGYKSIVDDPEIPLWLTYGALPCLLIGMHVLAGWLVMDDFKRQR